MLFLGAEDLLCLFLVLYFDPVIQKEMTGGFDFNLSFSSSPFKKIEKGWHFSVTSIWLLENLQEVISNSQKEFKRVLFYRCLAFQGSLFKIKNQKKINPKKSCEALFFLLFFFFFHLNRHKPQLVFKQPSGKHGFREKTATCVQRFDDSQILQFTLLIALCYVLHRYTSQEIHRWQLYVVFCCFCQLSFFIIKQINV